MSKALLTTEERKLLERAINLMEELVKTLEVIGMRNLSEMI